MLGWIVVIVVSAFWGAFAYRRLEIRRGARRRIEAAVKSAKPVLRQRANNDMKVLVRADDFEKAEKAYENAVARGEKKRWETVSYVVTPAFTFCDDRCDKKFTRTGTEEDCRVIIEEATLRASGLTREDFNLAEWDYWVSRSLRHLAELIVPESKFLFVPFSSHSMPDEKQAELFQPKTVAEAREYLLHQQFSGQKQG